MGFAKYVEVAIYGSQGAYLDGKSSGLLSSAKVSNESEAILCKSHNNANAIAMSEEVDFELMKKIVTNFIETPFSNVSKYIRRNNMIKEIENE